MGRPGTRAFGVLGIVLGTLLWAPPGVQAAPTPLNAHVTGADGHGRIEAPALSCADGGDGAYWHYAYSGSLPAGPSHGFSQLPGDVRLNIDLHSDEVRYPNTNANPLPAEPQRLPAGDGVDGLTAERPGHGATAALDRRRLRRPEDELRRHHRQHGRRRQHSGRSSPAPAPTRVPAATGTFGLVADVAPGADNPFTLDLNGSLTVRQPALDVAVDRARSGATWASTT